MSLQLAAVLAASLVAALLDVRTRRIPNAISLVLLVAAFALDARTGWASVATSVGIVAVILVAGTLAFSLKLIGGGDVKLFAAAGAVLGYPLVVPFALLTFLAGGVIGILFAAARGRLGVTLSNVRSAAIPAMAGVAVPRIAEGTPMPYALAIFAGAALLALTHAYAPHCRLFI